MGNPWPNTFIVGAAKSGTTSLSRYLDQHPDVFMSPENEPHFFTRTWELDADDLDEAKRGYRAMFADGSEHAIRGEKSPSYMVHPPTAERIREHVPEANIVAILRNPVERAHSHFLFQESTNRHLDEFLDDVLRDIGRYEVLPAEDRLEAYFYGDLNLFGQMGRYATQLERYIDTFGPDQVHVLLLEDLKADPDAELERLARFLDIDPDPLLAVEPEAHNAYRGPPNDLAKFLRTDPRVRRLARFVMPLGLREWIGNNVLVRPGDKPEMSQEARRMLAAYYEPEIDRLEDLFDESFDPLRTETLA